MVEETQPVTRTNQATNLPIDQIQVKICGLTNLDDALAAVEAGADLLGFIFYHKSPRYVAPEQVRNIVAHLRPGAAGLRVTGYELEAAPLPSPPLVPRLVGVFVNAPSEQIAQTLDYCGLDLAQLHGEEGPEALAVLSGRAYKALRPAALAEAEAGALRFGHLGPAGGPDLLVDAYHPRLRGGTGVVGDWTLAAALGVTQRYRLLLAGGLTADNVAQAVRQVQPWGVDVAGGVELAPGRKDRARVHAFVAAARGPGDNKR